MFSFFSFSCQELSLVIPDFPPNKYYVIHALLSTKYKWAVMLLDDTKLPSEKGLVGKWGLNSIWVTLGLKFRPEFNTLN